MTTEKPLRAAIYCRTSGEGQRDNTSIPRQKEDSNTLCGQNDWVVVEHYVDECKTGSKIDGREDFQRLLRDAANDQFDVVVVYDISRFARDGFDIMSSARTLKRDFGVDVVDVKGQYDTRNHRNTLTNFIHAGVSEHERLSIMERTQGGRIRKAEEGKPWTSCPPVGRAYDKSTGKWFITDKGRAIAEILKRYVEGESLKSLCTEFGFKNPQKISEWVHHGQLSGTYVARFHAPDIGLCKEVPVPAIPEIVLGALLEKTRKRLIQNRTFNRTDVRREYKLSGFVRCEQCGKALTGQARDDTLYYRHSKSDCKVRSVRAAEIETGVLDYLYGFFLDKPAFDSAVRAAMPTDAFRKQLQSDSQRAARQLAKKEQEIGNLVRAIQAGVDPSLLISQQGILKRERDNLTERLDDLQGQLANLPDPDEVERQAMAVRLILVNRYQDRDWRHLTRDEIKRFLIHLFGQSTIRTTTGIFVSVEGGNTVVNFRGNVEFHGKVVNGRPVSDALDKAMDVEINTYKRTVSAIMGSVRPLTGDWLAVKGFTALPFKSCLVLPQCRAA